MSSSVAEQSPFSGRRQTKSRNGCANCKRRKVKCDEGKPECFNCVRFGLHCARQVTPACQGQFLAHISTPAAIGDNEISLSRRKRGRPRKNWAALEEKTSSSSVNSLSPKQTDSPCSSSSYPVTSVPNCSTSQPPQSTCKLYVSEAELLIHFITFTAQSVVHAPSLEDPMAKFYAFNVPQIALKHHFVLHFIYALAGLHLKYLQGSGEKVSDHTPLVEAHFTAGLREFREALSNLDNRNCQALYVSAVMICYCVFAAGPTSANDLLVCNFDNGHLVPWLPLIHGVRIIHATIGTKVLYSGLMEPWAPPPDPSGARARTSTPDVEPFIDWEPQLLKLRQYVISQTTPFTTSCLIALDALITIYEATLGKRDGPYTGPAHNKTVFAWVYHLEQDFVEGLLRKETSALLVLAYYTIPLRTKENHWFLKGWADHLLASLHSIIMDAAAGWLNWPMEQKARILERYA